MFSITRSARTLVARTPMSARFYAAGEGSGSVASDKSFQAREQGQEAFYIKQQEREQLEKMRAKAKQELEAKQAEVDAIEEQHRALGSEEKK